jgi:hypothetical protein
MGHGYIVSAHWTDDAKLSHLDNQICEVAILPPKRRVRALAEAWPETEGNQYPRTTCDHTPALNRGQWTCNSLQSRLSAAGQGVTPTVQEYLNPIDGLPAIRGHDNFYHDPRVKGEANRIILHLRTLQIII